MKKLIDILFEPEEEEVVVEAPVTPVTMKRPEVQNDVLPKAKPAPVLEKPVSKPEEPQVKKASHSRSFGIIDVEELQVKKAPTFKHNTINPSKEYEAQPPISPIFGVVTDTTKKEEPVLKTPQLKPTKNVSHLGTVLSPIYGMSAGPNLKEDEKKGFEVEEPFAELDQIYEEYAEFENHSLEELLNYEEEVPYEEIELTLFDEILQGEDK